MAAEQHRLAQLPGFDTAPDVYETPDIEDDTTNSTLQTSPRAAASDTSDTSSDEDDEEAYGVSRRRLYPERARSRFGEQARNVDSRRVDHSDRIGGKRRGLRLRRGYGDEEEEGLEARLARLKREVEECKALAAEEKRKTGSGEEEDGEEDDEEGQTTMDEVEALSRLLSDIDMPTTRPQRGKVIFHDALPDAGADSGKEDHTTTSDEQTLNKISAFDTRLASLESALGISAVLDTSSEAFTTPLLPALTLLDEQLAALNSATSLAHLEAASSRIARLKAQAQQLHTTSTTGPSDEEEDPDQEASSGLSPTDIRSLNALYTILPTLQSLSPTVPALISRLRSLRTLHTTAATASADLDGIEQRQAEQERELKMWREGLERVEAAVKEANTANGRNGNFVREWVEELEGRVKGLGR